MKERPIIFTGESVRAILAGHKTQTRRAVKAAAGVCPACVNAGVPHNEGLLRDDDGTPNIAGAVFGTEPYLRVGFCEHNDRTGQRIRCPHGRVGDRLWVRETWAPALDFGKDTGSIFYRATYVHGGPCDDVERWKSPIFMPRRLSRLILEIVSVRVERLQSISEDDAKAEGIAEPAPVHGSWCDPARGREGHWSYRKPFAKAWDALHGKGAWEANPWVFVIGFKRIGA